MKSIPGAELACRGHNFDLPVGPKAQPKGVVSYYAIEALGQAQTMGEWLTAINALIQKDVDGSKLPMLYRPELQLVGSGGHLVF